MTTEETIMPISAGEGELLLVEGEIENEKKKQSKRDRPIKEKQSQNSKFKLDLDLANYQDAYLKFENIFQQANNKNVGAMINREDIFVKLLSLLNDDLILEIQKDSLSTDELNCILRTHLSSFCPELKNKM